MVGLRRAGSFAILQRARLKGLNLQLSYYRVSDGHYEGYEAGYDCPPYYFNPEVDTI
jgi:hypothetical protein